ncbi:cytidylyltransferase domain-containing protein [Rhizobium bangladeshense]|uniref:cytidylyltransferase domain-containing protein n=1 Tax=Rhizobium bangladeshense TaxID=1138189 RepID=UPI001C918C7A|nr:acylneuraminate cytidylyltransferase [Rhizobium bangladeshense]MBY3596241.1 acylneuraminate cytidylyltransferase [Rhizobium bangladeshense]
MTLGIIVQARMGSTRLPGKVMRLLNDRPLISHIVDRLGLLRHKAGIVVATGQGQENDVIESWCRENDVSCFRGKEHDVLDRYYQCAKSYGFTDIVRLTADNPFTDIAELDRLIDLHHRGVYDYTHAFGHLPVGVGGEIFTFKALERSHLEGLLPHHREHVNEYFTDCPELFRIGQLNIALAKTAPGLRLTVDTEDDWRRVHMLASKAAGSWLGTEEAIALCSSSV